MRKSDAELTAAKNVAVEARMRRLRWLQARGLPPEGDAELARLAEAQAAAYLPIKARAWPHLFSESAQ